MTEPHQIDLEEAISAAEKAQSEFLAPLQRKAPPVAEPVRAQARIVPASLKAQREERRARMVALAQELEKFFNEAKTKDSPMHRELSVRAGKRMAEDIFRKARALATVAAPPRYHTAPTPERDAHAGEAAKLTVMYEANKPQAVNHRWLWPVEQARRQGFLDVGEMVAADRFRRAFHDQQRMPRPTTYSDEPRAQSDPTNRNGLTPANINRQARQLALAGGECGYVWSRLEPEFRAVVWGLILEEPFPSGGAPLSLVAFGREVTKSQTEAHCRWFAFGQIKMACVRIRTLLHQLDVAAKKSA